MKFQKIWRQLAAVLFLAITMVAFTNMGSAPNTLSSERRRILVKPKGGLSETNLKKILDGHGGKSIQKIEKINVHVVELPATANARAVTEALKKNPNIKFAEVDELVPVNMTVNDPSFGSQWYLPKMQAPAAWDLTHGVAGAGVTIAILDSGVYGAHPDLIANMVEGWNTYDNNSDTSDVCGHGTQVAGTAAAAGNNGIGVAGVAFQSKIMPIRVAYLSNGSCMGSYSAIANGIIYAADHGAKVANASFAYLNGSSTVISAANYMNSKGGVVTTGSGNSNINEGYPENSSLLTVAATDTNDAKASFSSFGSYVDMSAPGVLIPVTNMSGGYSTNAGTSFSAPIVAGVAALVYSANSSLSASQVMDILESTATDLGTADYDIYFGHGRVNASAAVQKALNTVAIPVDSTAPVAMISSISNGASVSGLVPVNVSASDNVAVTKVELYAKGVLIASDTVAPYNFSWDSTQVANGSVALVAKAYDAAGNVGSSSTVSVNVANAIVADTTAPTVAISNPVNGSKVSGNVAIVVAASDNVAVTQVVIYIDGVQKASSTSSLNYTWNTRKASAGNHTILAVAKDAAGNSSSTSILVTK